MAWRPRVGCEIKGGIKFLDANSSYECHVKSGIFRMFNGVETEVEAIVFTNYAIRKLKSSHDPEFSRETSAAFVAPLAEMLYRETHSIYGSQVLDYPMEKAVEDATNILTTL